MVMSIWKRGKAEDIARKKRSNATARMGRRV